MPVAVPFATDPHLRFEEIRRLVSIYYDVTIQETLNYGRETAGSLSICLLCYVTLCVVAYLAFAYWKGGPWHSNGPLAKAKRVMFVIAHPDDECMFFGPVIMKLAQQKDCELHLLCLSKGENCEILHMMNCSKSRPLAYMSLSAQEIMARRVEDVRMNCGRAVASLASQIVM